MNRSDRAIIIWLFSGALLVLSMVVVGGITRLTQSGLSMVEWNLVMGSIPPLNEVDWQESFNKYKETPEFNIVNKDFNLSDFKSIFWWEYIHRLLGRFIGLVFIIPFLIFLVRRRFKPPLLRRLFLIFILGAFQGFLGWYMVKSGLVNVPHVSHFRLAAHLITALLLFSLIFWTALGLIYKNEQKQSDNTRNPISRFTVIGLIILGIQILYGAFVAGLKAGLYYNNWPKMGNYWIPSEVLDSISREGLISLVNNVTTVQFIHRYLAWVVVVVVVLIVVKSIKGPITKNLVKGIWALSIITFVQVLLGILTLIYKVPVTLGVLHQLASALVLASLLFILHRSVESVQQAGNDNQESSLKLEMESS